MRRSSNFLVCFLVILSAGLTSSCKTSKIKYDLSTEIDGVYIPVDLEDSFVQLDQLLSPEDIDTLKSKQSEDDLYVYHFGLGLWMRNNWGLWRGSRLNKYFNELGIFHPDDISGIILDSYWRRLNNLPIKLEEQIKYYQDYWKEMEHSN